MSAVEYWLCGECLDYAESHRWGGTDSTAICPHCGYEHRDDECSWVDARSTEFEIRQLRRAEMADA